MDKTLLKGWNALWFQPFFSLKVHATEYATDLSTPDVYVTLFSYKR